MTRPEIERLAIMETKQAAMNDQLAAMDAKLDKLMDLRSKGVGAFWLASSLIGTGIIGSGMAFWNWLSNH